MSVCVLGWRMCVHRFTRCCLLLLAFFLHRTCYFKKSCLGEVTWRRFVASLYLVVGEFDKCVVLLGQLGGQHGIVLFPQGVLSFLEHTLADHLYLFEREQRLLRVLDHARGAVRPAGTVRAHLGAARFRVLHTLAVVEGELLPAVQSFDLFRDVLGHFFWGQLGADGIGKRGRLRFHHGTAGSRRGRGAAEGVADGSAAAGGAGRTPEGVAPPALGRPLIETLPVERTFQRCTGHFVILSAAAG